MEQDPLFAYHRHLTQLTGITDAAWESLRNIAEVKQVERQQVVLEEGKVCTYIDFIFSGAFRAFYNNDGEEVTVGLYLPGTCFTNMKSLSTQTPSQLTIHALSPGIVVRIQKQEMIGLYQQVPEMESVGRKMLEHMLIQENEWKDMHTLYTPEKKYAFLLEKNPKLIQVFPLQFIASFLGMRRETLSRIRNRITS